MSDKNPRVEEKPLNDSQFEYKSKSFYEKLCYIKTHITVEPIFAGLVIGSMLSRIATQNLNLDKVCRVKKNFGDIICDSLIDRDGNYTSNEAEIQKVISEIETWRSVIQTAIPTVLVMFMGAWSDRTGNRKICILLPVIGEFSVCVSNILSTYFFYEIPVEVTMLLETLLPAITGGWVMMYLGVFSYISDITTTESRTFRVGMANLCMTAGIPIGTALSGILLKVGGYYGVFSISGIIYFITFLYGLINLKSCTKPGHDANEKVIIKTRLTHNFTSIQRDLALIVIIIVNYFRTKL